jgi:hypothetical protein
MALVHERVQNLHNEEISLSVSTERKESSQKAMVPALILCPKSIVATRYDNGPAQLPVSLSSNASVMPLVSFLFFRAMFIVLAAMFLGWA